MIKLRNGSTYNAKRDDRQETLDEKRSEKAEEHRWNVLHSGRAKSIIFAIGAVMTWGRKVKHQLGNRLFCVDVPITHDAGNDSNQKYLEHWIRLDESDSPERFGPVLRGFDEKSTSSTTEDANDNVEDDLKVVPICHILDLEHYNLVCAVGVEKLER